jgi:hypothetical protein
MPLKCEGKNSVAPLPAPHTPYTETDQNFTTARLQLSLGRSAN